MEKVTVEKLRAAVHTARDAAERLNLNGCDVSELDEIIEPIHRELDSNQPNVRTLATYLNSLARSLRADPAGRSACLGLDAAMREAGVPTDWEH
ncbi:MAG: hypothetical protein DIU71_10120 [Proteobacteria bacterium]|nr:MAG: hypothetical protein DIU71_10120 [Pseudomonadota bacterium]